MTTRNDPYATASAVAVVGVLLAVPFSCLLARAILLWMEHQPNTRDTLSINTPMTA